MIIHSFFILEAVSEVDKRSHVWSDNTSTHKIPNCRSFMVFFFSFLLYACNGGELEVL